VIFATKSLRLIENEFIFNKNTINFAYEKDIFNFDASLACFLRLFI
jgi:hypothetical protein